MRMVVRVQVPEPSLPSRKDNTSPKQSNCRIDRMRSFAPQTHPERKRRAVAQDDTYRKFALRNGESGAGELHFAVIQKDNANQDETKRPEPCHYTASLIFGGKAKLQPARPSRGHGQHGEGNVTQVGEQFFLEVPQAVGMGEE